MYVCMGVQDLSGPCQEKMAEGGLLEAIMAVLLQGADLTRDARPAVPSETTAW